MKRNESQNKRKKVEHVTSQLVDRARSHCVILNNL